MKVGWAAFSLAAVGIVLGVGVAMATPPGSALAPHRAVYAMDLASTKMGTGVTGATGAMTYKFGDTCDGWTVENKTALTFAYSDGAPVATVWDFVTWESKDGLRYRFRVRNTRDGVVTEEIEGTANLDGPGKGGVAKFTLPEEKTLSLPKGTLFPTEHTRQLLEYAAQGAHVLQRVLFDGTATDDSLDVNAVIGKTVAGGVSPVSAKPSIDTILLSPPSWYMQLAFFPKMSEDPAPDYEVALRYYQNGVADQIVQSFGNFSLRGTLETLERLPTPDC
jgi:hypothetical protein